VRIDTKTRNSATHDTPRKRARIDPHGAGLFCSNARRLARGVLCQNAAQNAPRFFRRLSAFSVSQRQNIMILYNNPAVSGLSKKNFSGNFQNFLLI